MPFSPPVLLMEDRIELRRKQKEGFKRMKFRGKEFTKAYKPWFIYMAGLLVRHNSKSEQPLKRPKIGAKSEFSS